MQGSYLIEVASKRGTVDPLGKEIAEEAHHLGVRSVHNVSTSQLYRLVGELNVAERQRIGKDLLTDPVTQEFHDGGWNPSPLLPLPSGEGKKDKIPSSAGRGLGEGLNKAVVVDVWYKQGVTDVIGESVLKGLRDIQIPGIKDVRTGTRYRFWGLRDVKVVEKLAVALLANPLVHDKVIHAD